MPLADLITQRRARHDKMTLEPPYSNLPKAFPVRPNANGSDGDDRND